MATVGFIGVGNMGGPMARNLIKAGYTVRVFDLSQPLLDNLASDGAVIATSAADTVTSADMVITMLPAGEHVEGVFSDGLLDRAAPGTVFVDCSTIDVATARRVHEAAIAKGFEVLDAPVSGGVGGARAGTLTFMIGGSDVAFEKAKPLLEVMGANLVRCGGAGNGQAAKICNNMMLGIQMASVAEAFVLAEHLGLDAESLFNVSSTASGQCWSLTTYCPVPGLVPTSPANNDYQPGFSAALMLKDMRLALAAADDAGQTVDAATTAARLYETYIAQGGGSKDFSAIIEHIRGLTQTKP